MPGWHEATGELQEQGKIQTVGIIQEQHPRRARLFMQWKQMDWPVLVDSLDLLDVSVVPITVLIDERGIVREVVSPRSRPLEVVERFLAAEYSAPDEETERTQSRRPDLERLRRAAADGGAGERAAYARDLTTWGGPDRIDDAIRAYSELLERDSTDARARFRLGVAYRMRYDSDHGDAADFEHAVRNWTRALELDPNNYIWRRRIQQFGPRLDKPYPFYDWVAEARDEIRARGETPVDLGVEPRGAEIARPSRSFEPDPADREEPDPEGRIHRDEAPMVRVHATVVPPRVKAGGTARVHLEFRVNPERDAHWNNEAKGPVVWIDAPDGWRVDRRRIELPLPATATSDEIRRAELEVQSPEGAAGTRKLQAYALYYVCEDDGPCLYRRQDIPLAVQID